MVTRSKVKKTIKEVKQAIPVKKDKTENQSVVIEVRTKSEKELIKKLSRKHLIAKRREEELKALKIEFNQTIVQKYLTEGERERVANFKENKYVEFVAGTNAVRNGLQYEVTYDNDMLLELAKEKDVLNKVAKVSITNIRPFLNDGEEEEAISQKVIVDKITVAKK